MNELELRIKELEERLAKYETTEPTGLCEPTDPVESTGPTNPVEPTELCELCEPPKGNLGEQFIVTPSDTIVQIIMSTCRLKNGNVYHNDKLVGPWKQLDPSTKVKYPKEYIEAVLKGENPDISFLFTMKEGVLHRSQHPLWTVNQKGSRVIRDSHVCGTTIRPIGAKTNSSTVNNIDLSNIVLTPDKVLYRGQEDKAFRIGNKVYTASYLRHLVEGTGKKKPLSMFYKVNNVIVRSEHKCWTAFKLQRVAESVNINDTNYTVIDLYKAKDISEKAYVKLLADNVFSVENGQLLFAGKPYTESRMFGGLRINPDSIWEIKGG